MEFTKADQLRAGIFVILGIVVFSTSLLFLGDDQMLFSSTYTLGVRFDHVQGLNPGSTVTVAGLRCGNVKKIDFEEAGEGLVVTLEIQSRFQSRITVGSRASVKTLGALGDKYIYITPGEPSSRPLRGGEMIESDGADDFLDRLAKNGDKLSAVVDVVNELNTLLKNLNEDGKSRKLADNLVDVSRDLKHLVSDLKNAVAGSTANGVQQNRLRDVMERLQSILAKVDRGEGTLGALINDPTLHQKLMSLIGESPRRTYLRPLIRETIQHRDRESLSK